MDKSHQSISSTFEDTPNSSSSSSISPSDSGNMNMNMQMDVKVNLEIGPTSIDQHNNHLKIKKLLDDDTQYEVNEFEETKCIINGNSKIIETSENNEKNDTTGNIKNKSNMGGKIQKPKKKSKNKSSLDNLLASSLWYVTQLTPTGRTRDSSIRYQKLKEQKIRKQEQEKEQEQERTPEEIESIRLLKERRKEIAKKNLELKSKKKEEKMKAAQLRKQLILEGKIEPKKKPRSSIDNDNPKNYFRADGINALLQATSHFVNIGKKFDESSRRETKPVERYSPEDRVKKTKNHDGRVRSLKKKMEDSKPEIRVKKEIASKKIKKTKTKNPKQTKKEKKTSEKDSEKEKELESEMEPEEPSSIWFTDIKKEGHFPIDKEGWRFFQDFVYEEENDKKVPSNLIQAADIIKRRIKLYRTDNEQFALQEVELNYPFSDYKEKYLLALSRDDVQFNPFDEIGKMMELIAIVYLPDNEKIKVINEENPSDCIVGKYIESFEQNDAASLIKIIGEFNSLIDVLKENKSILKFTKQRKDFPLAFIYELLNQCYTRSVLPDCRKLKRYKAFSNEVYGELMPSFLTTVYGKCNLNNDSYFMDLGSGVGNCVIQAAVEFGCKSFGVEIVTNASNLGDEQLKEFEKRCEVLGLNPGFVKLFSRQSFVNNPSVKEIVDKCDVILVNNYLFDTDLNTKVIDLFLNLKVGTKIISLKPIVPPGYTMKWDTCDSILNRLKTQKFIYEDNSVSWTSNGGFYYITEVMEDIVEDNFVIFRSRSRRSRDLGLDERSRSSTPLNAFTNNV